MRFLSMRRASSPYGSTYSFGPGPLSLALKALLGANVVMFVAQAFVPRVTDVLGLTPYHVVHGLQVWRVATYMFLHAGVTHVAINMLTLWMFGAELERVWGTRYFLKFYLATGIGAGVLTVLVGLLPFAFAREIYTIPTVGASGAIFGLLLAYGMYYPDRPIYMYFVFPIPARYFVLIIGAISFFAGGGIAHATHLGGVAVGYAMLKGPRVHPLSEVKYRYFKWKINRVRRKFDVYSGGRADDWDRRVH
jgi:membrane associated rhomboid family serine protease